MLDRTIPHNLARKAVLYRMVMQGHTCPYGLKTKDLLQRSGYEVDDHHLTTREETDAFKAQHGVPTTPQVFIDGKRVGGYDDLRRFLGKPVADPKATTYRLDGRWEHWAHSNARYVTQRDANAADERAGLREWLTGASTKDDAFRLSARFAISHDLRESTSGEEPWASIGT